MVEVKGNRTAKYIDQDNIEIKADYIENLNKFEFLELYAQRTGELSRVDSAISNLNLQLDKLAEDLNEVKDLDELKQFAKKMDLARKYLAHQEVIEKLRELEKDKVRREKELINFKDAYLKASNKNEI